MTRPSHRMPLEDRGPLKVMFVITSMPVGGAEVLLSQLVRGLDRERFEPSICCLKEPGELGEVMGREVSVYAHLLRHKYDLRVLGRLTRLMKQDAIDAVITVGAGDKMFWGRMAAKQAGLPVVCSAIHSTGWPDQIGRLNRWLTGITDRFIAVASSHGRFLVTDEGFPEQKVVVIPNGIDVQRFSPDPQKREAIRRELGIASDAPCTGIVAALRPEKNHLLFLRAADLIRKQLPTSQFVIVGDGVEREKLEVAVGSAGLQDCVHFLGTRSDTEHVLNALDCFMLTSHMEASPVSILEAMATGLPVVATDVGSIHETVLDQVTGFLVPAGDASRLGDCALRILQDRGAAEEMGRLGRERVEQRASLESMVGGYEQLMEEIYRQKFPGPKVGSNSVESKAAGPASLTH